MFEPVGRFKSVVPLTVSVLLSLIGVLPCYAAPKVKPGQGYVEGYVRENGKPVKGVDLLISGAPYVEDNSFAVPIITSRVVGVVGANSPPSVVTGYARPRTDKNGHYEAILPAGLFYLFTTKGKQDIPAITRLFEVTEGKGTSQDFDMGAKWHGAELAVDDFNRGFSRVLASAKEEPPLMSLVVGHSLPSAVVTRVTLPGADFCTITDLGSIVVDGKQIAPMRLAYACFARYPSQEGAVADYESLVKLVAAASGLVPTPSTTQNHSTEFRGSGLVAGDLLDVSISKNNNAPGGVSLGIMYSTVGRSLVM